MAGVWWRRNRWASYEDCYSEACVGLVKAMGKYDPARGMSFPAYAVMWMRSCVRHYLRREAARGMTNVHHSDIVRVLLVSLDSRDNNRNQDGGGNLFSATVVDRAGPTEAEVAAFMGPLLAAAGPCNREILTAYYVDGLSSDAVARKYRVSQTRLLRLIGKINAAVHGECNVVAGPRVPRR